MGRNPKNKLKILNEKELNNLIKCSKCSNIDKYRNMFFYVDESNIAITKNSKPICKTCK